MARLTRPALVKGWSSRPHRASRTTGLTCSGKSSYAAGLPRQTSSAAAGAARHSRCATGAAWDSRSTAGLDRHGRLLRLPLSDARLRDEERESRARC